MGLGSIKIIFVTDCHWQVQCFAVADNIQGSLVTDLQRLDISDQLLAGRILRAVHTCNDIVRAQVCCVSWRFEDNLCNYGAFFNISTHLLCNLVSNRHQRCANERNRLLRNFLVGFQFVYNLFNGVHCDRKADTL
ncbi:hypothetical protein D3C76_1433010 [compost metagenome]